MDLSRVFIIGAEFKELQSTQTAQHFYAEVILIDRTFSEAPPTLYQLTPEPNIQEDLKAIKRGIITLSNDAFVMVGEVKTVNKATKTILMTNDNTVTYKYLIIVNRNKNSAHHEPLAKGTANGEELTNSLKTLFYALLLSKTLPSVSLKTKTKNKNTNFAYNSPSESQKMIEKIVNTQLSNDTSCSAYPLDPHQNICELQV